MVDSPCNKVLYIYSLVCTFFLTMIKVLLCGCFSCTPELLPTTHYLNVTLLIIDTYITICLPLSINNVFSSVIALAYINRKFETYRKHVSLEMRIFVSHHDLYMLYFVKVNLAPATPCLLFGINMFYKYPLYNVP